LNTLLQSVAPVIRLAVLVGYGDDQYVVTFYGVNDIVGESIQPAASGLCAERMPLTFFAQPRMLQAIKQHGNQSQ
jgi:hypothetical protein